MVIEWVLWQALSGWANRYGFAAREGATHLVDHGVTRCGKAVGRGWESMGRWRGDRADIGCATCRRLTERAREGHESWQQ